MPSPASAVNSILTEYDLKSIESMGELCLGDLTLVVGLPETDPLPKTANITYIGSILWQKRGARLPLWAEDLSEDVKT